MRNPRGKRSASDAIRIATQRPGRFPHASLGTILWITIVWVLLWGDVTPGNILSGFGLALLITTVAPFPTARFDGRFRPKALAWLAVVFVWDLLKASWQQAWFIVRGKYPNSAIIRVHLRSNSDAYLAMTAGMTALVPGSVVVDADQTSGMVYVHIFDVELAGGLDAAHAAVLDLEERILRAFASRNELLKSGFVPGWSTTSGRLPVPSIAGLELQED
ncbi:Na+/H+ antiporter subunit E [Changpingibacter yushuensis]|uniref:Na+/H+ antiporter subunit E n=1 Tax=Changpingibacter yushuensis TaxID=2758440 RepID=UPI00165E59BB|nr:Na+/H+ antiporter subunit E [Changpingibacter yushuensis]